MCNISHLIIHYLFYVCGNSAVLDDCIAWHMYHHIPTTTTKKTACHTRVRVVLIQQTHGMAVPWVEQTKSPSCAHTPDQIGTCEALICGTYCSKPRLHNPSRYIPRQWNTIEQPCHAGNLGTLRSIHVLTITANVGAFTTFYWRFSNHQSCILGREPWVNLVSVLRPRFKHKWNDIQGQMSVVSSNMIMGEGNPRVVGGWVLLPLVGERFMVWWGGCLWQPPLRFESSFWGLKSSFSSLPEPSFLDLRSRFSKNSNNLKYNYRYPSCCND